MVDAAPVVSSALVLMASRKKSGLSRELGFSLSHAGDPRFRCQCEGVLLVPLAFTDIFKATVGVHTLLIDIESREGG